MKLKRQSAVKLMEDSVPEPLGVPYVALATGCLVRIRLGSKLDIAVRQGLLEHCLLLGMGFPDGQRLGVGTAPMTGS